ncbi:ankyrin repeat-containing domain protein, partial [Dactylonectria macrodidyma]
MLLSRPPLGYPTIYRLIPIQLAAARGLTSIVKELLLGGVSVNEGARYDMPPLQFAICGGRFETVKVLIEKGALLNFANSNTAAHFAATSGSTDIMDYLLKRGLDINATNIWGDTPMCFALSSPFNIWKMMVPYLIQRGA